MKILKVKEGYIIVKGSYFLKKWGHKSCELISIFKYCNSPFYLVYEILGIINPNLYTIFALSLYKNSMYDYVYTKEEVVEMLNNKKLNIIR